MAPPKLEDIQKVVTEPMAPWPPIDEETVANVTKVLKNETLSQLSPGENVIGRFERAFAEYCGVKYALSCNGGTSALTMAVRAAGAGPGDEVITSTYTWNATALAIVAANVIPVLADIDPDTLLLDLKSVEKLITPRTRAIIPVHLYGHPVDMDPLMEIARKHDLVVIEDCAQAHGALYKGRRVGSLGHIGAFSFQGSKNLPAGEGGMILANDKEVFTQCVLMGAHPVRQKADVPADDPNARFIGEFCENFRMHPLGAAILESYLPRLDERNGMRRKNAMALYDRIKDVPGIEPPTISPDVEHVFHMVPFMYRADQLGGTPRDVFLKVALAKGAPLFCYIGTPLHLRARFLEQHYYKRGCPWKCPFAEREVIQGEGDCPAAEKHCREHELMMGAGFLYVECDKLLDQIAEAIRQAAEEAPAFAKRG